MGIFIKSATAFTHLLDIQRQREDFMAQDDMRRRIRVAFNTLVTINSAEGALVDLSSRDISLKGVFVLTKTLWPVDTPVEVKMSLTGSTSKLSLSMKGMIKRHEPDGMGVDFTEVDVDSFAHLRNIVSYNTGDAEVVDEEISEKPAF